MSGPYPGAYPGGAQHPGAAPPFPGPYTGPAGVQQPYQQPPQGFYQANPDAAYSQQPYAGQQGFPGPAPYEQHPPYAPYPQQAQPPADQAFSIPNLPLNFMGASLLAGSQTWGQQLQQRVQQRMGWLSGGALNYHFNISKHYVLTKLLMLMAPYLNRWNYTRQPEQIQGGHKYRPPRGDPASPDLYLPLVSMWTYVLLLCINAALQGQYKPDMMYASVWSAGMAWVVHAVVAYALLRAMNLPASVPWVELFAYTGYSYVPVCASLLLGIAAGKWAYRLSWLYGSLCMSVFLVRTMKRTIFQEARSYGPNLTLTNYLLLALAVFQFPLAAWLGNVTLPGGSHREAVHAAVRAALASPSPIKG